MLIRIGFMKGKEANAISMKCPISRQTFFM